MTGSAHLLSSLLFPALGGGTVGFVAGVFATLYWVGRSRERGRAVPIYSEADHPEGRPWRAGEHLSRLGWVLLVLSVAGLIAGTVSLFQTTAQARCLATFTTSSAEAQRERAEAAELDRRAIRQQRAVTREFNQVLIDAVANPVTDPAAREKARDSFLAKARDWDARLAEVDRLDGAAEAQRRHNPLPLQPDC